VKYIRYKIPIIFLTAYFNDEILEYAKDANPKGYIIKPFKEQELEATIKLAIYQQNEKKELISIQNIYFDNYNYNISEQKLFRNNKKIKLSKKSLKLLDILCQNKNRTVSYETLIHELYEESTPKNIDNLRHLNQTIKREA
jgi:DNA-binding response OmpR family regulator